MRTRALLYIVLGYLIFAALLAADLVAHGYRALQGISFECFRAILQGIAASWIIRGGYTLFFRPAAVARHGDAAEGAGWAVKLVRRFDVVLGSTLLLAFLPGLFKLSLTEAHEPASLNTLISIDVIGAVWMTAFAAALLSFWQLVFLRQQTHHGRRRFTTWAVSTSVFGFAYFLTRWHEENFFQTVPGLSIVGILVIVVIISILMLGYRLPWLPYLPRAEKKQMLWLSLLSLILGASLFFFYIIEPPNAYLLKDYAIYWREVTGAVTVTFTIYFGLVFFSTLFTLSSSDVVERKSAEVKSLVKLTRFSSDVLSSELLLDLPRLADQITTLAREATNSDAAWLELRTNTYAPGKERSEDAIVTSQLGISEAAAEAYMSTTQEFPDVSDTIKPPREELIATRKAFLVRKRRARKRAGQLQPELNSLVAVPLIRRNEVRGGLYVGKTREDGFDDDDLTVLSAFSDVASLALETARLLADSMEKQKFDGELRAARVMQKSLLPAAFPNIPGFDIDAVSIPAYDVGGDYYDFSVLSDGSPTIVIGDVSGKGISASIYMAETKGVVQALAAKSETISGLLQGTNMTLLRNSPNAGSLRRSFVTLGLLSFGTNANPTGKQMVRYCRAGHTPLLRLRRDGTCEYVQPKGMAVGLMPQSLFDQMLEQQTLEVESGDLLVFFSDGITDTRNPAGEPFGYTRLAEAIAPVRAETPIRKITLSVLNAISDFSESDSFGDDATLVVIRAL